MRPVVYCPGNAGTSICDNIAIAVNDFEALANFV
jgi:hypothetical protein